MKNVSPKWGIAIAIIFSTSIALCLSFHITLLWAITVTLLIGLSVLKWHGIPYTHSLKWISKDLNDIKMVCILILMIGMNVSMWISSGTVPMLIYYGFDLVNHVIFLPFAFIMTGIIAFFLGTGLGTMSTVGIALFALGSTIGIPPAILMGALLSGSYIADRLSPLSALVHFTLETTGATFKAYFMKTSLIMLPMAAISLVFFTLLGMNWQSPSDTSALKGILSEAFYISPWLFLMPLSVLLSSLMGMKAFKVLSIGMVIGSIFSIALQGVSPLELVQFLVLGFKTDSPDALMTAMQIGGILPMLEVVFIVMGGMAMSTLYDKCGWLRPITRHIMTQSKNTRSLVFKTGLLSTVLNALTCDQTVGILIPGKHLKEAFHAHDLDTSDLAQVIANTGTAIAPLMPWNVNAMILFTITGVSAMQYTPYAAMNLFSFIICLFLTGGRTLDSRKAKHVY